MEIYMDNKADQNFKWHVSRIPSLTEGMEVYSKKGLIYVDCGLSCDTFNVILLYDGGQLPPGELYKAVTYFKQRELAYCLWVREENLLAGVRAEIQALGLGCHNRERGMELDLPEFKPVQDAAHAAVRIATQPRQIADYARVIACNWEPPDEHVLRYYEATAGHILDQASGMRLLLYYEEERAVAGIEMCASDEEVIGLYGLATLPSHRRMGIGSSLMTYALGLAKEMGYSKAILQATPDGIGIYRKYGFRETTTYYEFS